MSAYEGPWKGLIASAISLGAVGMGVVHVVKPELKIDGATLVLAAIAVIPWLGHLFESIELPGGTKLQYRRLEERVEAAERQAQEVRLAVDDASRQARVALVTSGGDGVTGDAAAELVEQLIREFTGLRRNETSSAARTYRQEQIFSELIRLTPQLTEFDTDAVLPLRTGGRGSPPTRACTPAPNRATCRPWWTRPSRRAWPSTSTGPSTRSAR